MAFEQQPDRVDDLAHKLDERIKELNCLYGISRLAEDRQMPLEELLQKIVEIIPRSWQYTDAACARIRLHRKAYATTNFRKTRWCQSEVITVNGEATGSIEVCYTAKMPENDEGPFLKEERHLIRELAERLGTIIERSQAEANLQRLYQEEKNLREHLQAEMQWRVEFTRNLIHELKTPLTSLVATSQLLYEEETDEKLNKLARYVCEGANNLNNRIDELHDIVRGEMGSITFNPKPVDIAPLLSDLAAETRAFAEQHDVVIELDATHPLPQVLADAVRVRQIVGNLLNNAIRYAADGKKVIIKALRKGHFVAVEVRDFGPGVRDYTDVELFDPGYKTIHHSKRSGGLGIGLSLCKILVELHGGTIQVTNLKKGASFLFTLPVAGGGNDNRNQAAKGDDI